jgi:hypothetical protein
MKFRRVEGKEYEELKSKIESGELKQCHLYHVRNVLHPRGPMKKESVGEYLLDRMKDAWEEWTDPKYGDNPSEEILIELLKNNLMNESINAIEEFLEWKQKKSTKP